jgi:hypothetical protein
MTGVPQPQAVVEHYPRAPERPCQGLLLAWRGVDAVAVPDLHETRTYPWPTTTNG